MCFISWARHTLACFPQPLQQFYAQNPCPHETKQVLRQRVEDEYRRWKCKYISAWNFASFSTCGDYISCSTWTTVSWLLAASKRYSISLCRSLKRNISIFQQCRQKMKSLITSQIHPRQMCLFGKYCHFHFETDTVLTGLVNFKEHATYKCPISNKNDSFWDLRDKSFTEQESKQIFWFWTIHTVCTLCKMELTDRKFYIVH